MALGLRWSGGISVASRRHQRWWTDGGMERPANGSRLVSGKFRKVGVTPSDPASYQDGRVACRFMRSRERELA